MNQQEPSTIVVVEDEQSVRMSIMSILRSEGYNVMGAEHGGDALRILKNSNVDLILSDIHMPEVDGVAFYEKVQEDAQLRHIPFIFLTSMTAHEQQIRGRELGVDDYITKPFERDVLVASIRGKLKRAASIEASHLQEIDRLKKEILKSLNDEVRVPANIIRNISALLLDKGIGVSSQQLTDLLASIKAGGDRLQRGLNDFIMALQIESSAAREQYQSEKSNHELSEVMKEVLLQSAAYRKAKNVEVSFSPPAKSGSLVGSRKQLEQLLERIVYSAVCLSNSGGRVEIIPEAGDRKAILTVRVGGSAISKTDLPHVFEKSYKIRHPHEDQYPIGLSLYNAKHLAEINNGDLSCVSQAGVGTTFAVVLPLA